MKTKLMAMVLAAGAMLGLLTATSLTAYGDTLTVHDGTATSGNVPVHGSWADAYLKCEYVLPASELAAMNGQGIFDMTWYLSSPAATSWTGTFQVFLKEVASTTISAYTGTEGATVVYEGTLDGTATALKVEFSTPYLYNGGNLLVGVYQIAKGYYKSAEFLGETVNGASVQGYNSDNIDSASVNQRNFLPKTTFTYGSVETVAVTFDENFEGGLTTNMTILASNKVLAKAPEVANRDGWTFVGWFTAATGGEQIADETLPTDGATYYAHWAERLPEIAFELHDSYGDSWNGASIRVVDADTETVITNLTVDGTSAAGVIPVAAGTNVRFEWVGGYCDGECSYAVCGIDDEEIFSGSGGFSTPIVYTAVLPVPTSVTFDENFPGGLTTNMSVKSTAKVLKSAPAVSTREGWAFIGWFTTASGGERVALDALPTEGATYYAHWAECDQAISFELHDGSNNNYGWDSAKVRVVNADAGVVITNLTVEYGEKDAYGSLPVPSGMNIRFEWVGSTSGGDWAYYFTIYGVDGEEILSSDAYGFSPPVTYTTFAPVWVPVTYDENFDGGGTTNKNVAATGKVLKNAPAVSARDGWAFIGWYTAAEGGEKIMADALPSSGATYYAHWSPLDQTIFYELHGRYNNGWHGAAIRIVDMDSGSVITNLTVASGKNDEEGTVSVAAGMTLRFEWVGGSYDSACSYAVYGEEGDELFSRSQYGFGDPIVHAVVKATMVSVTFDGNVEGGGVHVVSLPSKRNVLKEAPEVVVRGWTFVGWFIEATGGEQITDETLPTDGATYYAHWVATESVTVTFDFNYEGGGTVVTNLFITDKVLDFVPEAPARPGWGIAGWFAAPGGSTEIAADALAEAGATYFARWTKAVTVGSGSDSNENLPTHSYYKYSLTQQIYTPEEIGGACKIRSIAFKNVGAEKTRTLDVYLVQSDKSSFAGNKDWIAVTAEDKVFSGSVTFTSGEWTSIIFNAPFLYDGTDNLVVIVDDNTGSYSSGMSCYVFAAPNMAIRVYSDDTNYTPANPNGYSGTVLGYKNQMQLTVSEYVPWTGDLSCLEGDVTVTNGMTLTGRLAGNYKVSIAEGATVTLKDVTIGGGDDYSFQAAGITCLGDATIVLDGANVVTGFYNGAGIYVPQDKTLTIQGTGSLDVQGGRSSSGIGANAGNHCGNIVIAGGTINATGEGGGAGIGSGGSGNCGGITISGGIVTATGGGSAAGIGAGYQGICGDISISDGTVKAYGGAGGAGIGAGGAYYYNSTSGNCGNITISGGTVEAVAGSSAAGIGAAGNGGNLGGGGNCGDITISGGTVTATGKGEYYGGAGIGGAYFGGCGAITITEDVTKVTASADADVMSIGNRSGAVTIGGVVYYDGTNFQNNGASEITGLKQATYVYVPAPAVTGGTVVFKSGVNVVDWTVSAEGTDVMPGTTVVDAGKTVTVSYSGEARVKRIVAAKRGAIIDLSTVTATIEAQDCDVLTGTLGADVKIFIADGARVTLKDASISKSSSNSLPGIECVGDATIILEGRNDVSSEESYGILVAANKTLTIGGEGYMSVRSSGASGIGGWKGNVVILGGDIYAQGGSYAAGIGGVSYDGFGNITISGGSVTANGGYGTPGIGGGYMSSCGDIVIAESVTRVEAYGGNYARAISTFSSLTIGGTGYTSGEFPSDRYYEYTGDGTGGGAVVPGELTVSETVAGHAWTFTMDAFDVAVDVALSPYGSGTEADPYRIGTYDDLVLFASLVNGGETNAWAIVTNDIVATATDWTPIACDNNSLYTGTFDGQGHAISGLSNASISPTPDFAGLFGYVLAGGKVRNVRMVNVNFACEICGGSVAVGAIEGGTVENCTSSGTVIGAYVGGIVGGLTEAAVVESCSSSCDVTGGYAGGIAGYCAYESVVTNCTANCVVTGSGSYAGGGGIVGMVDQGKITHCSAAGNVTGYVAGGILGYGYDRASVEICRSSCDVTGKYYVGGIVAYNDKGTIYNCFNTGVIEETDNNDGVESSGGVVGVSYGGTVENCHNIGAVTGANWVGGVVGANVGSDTATNKVLSCYSLDTVATGVLVGYEEGRTECSNLLALSAAEFKNQANFVDWDFDNVWIMGADAPMLRAFADPDQAAADAVAAAIDAIGEVAYTDASKAKIDAARAAYDALTPAQQALVANYATLTAAEAAYAALVPAPGGCYQVLIVSDITAPYAAAKTVTLRGAVYDGCDVVGIVELKLGKVNAKKKTGKISGSVIGLDGKKRTVKSTTVTGIDGTGPATVSLAVKNLGTMTVTIGGSQFAGSLGGLHVQSADVGGSWTGGGATVSLETDSLSMFEGTVLTDLLPTNEVATVARGKWVFKKAAGVKWAKPKKGAPQPERYDAASGKGLVIDTAGGKTNLSGIKLTYTPKTGVFKGSFKVYALQGAGKATKLKKYTVKVSGVVVDGGGYGAATSKKPSVSWSVSVR